MATARAVDISGKTFGELLVVKRAGMNRHGALWECLCSCGETCIKLGHKLNSGATKTCGHSITHCLRGHEFTEENTYINAEGGRVCRACKREWVKDQYTPVENPRTNQNDGKTHCIHGHELSGENLVIKKNTDGSISRVCRTCRNAEARESARAAEAKYRALKKSDPVAWEEERRRRRAEQLGHIGWTLELFDEKWVEQEGKCAICKRELNTDVKHNIAKAHADHAHVVPPVPREILCGNCNIGIGNLQENPEIIKSALAYVEKWKEQLGTQP